MFCQLENTFCGNNPLFFISCQNAHRHFPHRPESTEQSQGEAGAGTASILPRKRSDCHWMAASLGQGLSYYLSYRFLSRTAECTGAFKDPPDPEWIYNLGLGEEVLDRVSGLNVQLSLDSLGEREKTCLCEHISP